MQRDTRWKTPEIVEIGMNAEIGGYQADFTDSEPVGPRGPVAGDAIVAKTVTKTAPRVSA